MENLVTDKVSNWIANRKVPSAGGKTFEKISPATGEKICDVASSSSLDVDVAVACAKAAQPKWSGMTPVARGEILRNIAITMQKHQDEIAEVVALETGKSKKEALGETGAAIEQGFFMAGEGRRLYGKTTTSGMAERTNMSIRRPVGVAGLIIAANTPIANVAWKVFPALICGNTVVLKPSEDTPMVAQAFAQVAEEAGLPDGVLNIVNGLGKEVGAPLVEHEGIDLVSFTGSTEVGRWIAQAGGKRIAKVFLELGGKNPLVVCDDADLENAVNWILLSAFSNAGQRCAAASRIIVFESVYEKLKGMLIEATAKLNIGATDDDDFGPVINMKQLENMVSAVDGAVKEGGKVLTGGARLAGEKYDDGCYMAPTLMENIGPDSEMAQKELFGPVAALFKVKNLEDAIELSNRSSYGLTACIHTVSVHRAMEYAMKTEAGSVNVNVGTYGSEPHFGFGGVKQSGNGLREPGTEALDVYTEWKNVNINILPDKI